MLTKIKDFLAAKKMRSLFNASSLGTYVIGIVALSVAWSSIKVIQRNYQLLKQISTLEQQVAVAEVRVENQKLQNQYYQSDAFLELAARRQFNKAAPGEQLLIVPKSVALAKVPDVTVPTASTAETEQPQKLSNWQAWLQFLSGRGVDD